MICALIERIEEGYRCDAQFMGYGNHTLGEAFKMEGIDIEKELDKMKIGEAKVWNIGWFPNDICKRRYLPEKVIKCVQAIPKERTVYSEVGEEIKLFVVVDKDCLKE